MFEIHAGGDRIARRVGSWFDELRGRGWPQTDDVVHAVRDRLSALEAASASD